MIMSDKQKDFVMNVISDKINLIKELENIRDGNEIPWDQLADITGFILWVKNRLE